MGGRRACAHLQCERVSGLHVCACTRVGVRVRVLLSRRRLQEVPPVRREPGTGQGSSGTSWEQGQRAVDGVLSRLLSPSPSVRPPGHWISPPSPTQADHIVTKTCPRHPQPRLRPVQRRHPGALGGRAPSPESRSLREAAGPKSPCQAGGSLGPSTSTQAQGLTRLGG